MKVKLLLHPYFSVNKAWICFWIFLDVVSADCPATPLVYRIFC